MERVDLRDEMNSDNHSKHELPQGSCQKIRSVRWFDSSNTNINTQNEHAEKLVLSKLARILWYQNSFFVSYSSPSCSVQDEPLLEFDVPQLVALLLLQLATLSSP